MYYSSKHYEPKSGSILFAIIGHQTTYAEEKADDSCHEKRVKDLLRVQLGRYLVSSCGSRGGGVTGGPDPPPQKSQKYRVS